MKKSRKTVAKKTISLMDLLGEEVSSSAPPKPSRGRKYTSAN